MFCLHFHPKRLASQIRRGEGAVPYERGHRRGGATDAGSAGGADLRGGVPLYQRSPGGCGGGGGGADFEGTVGRNPGAVLPRRGGRRACPRDSVQLRPEVSGGIFQPGSGGGEK